MPVRNSFSSAGEKVWVQETVTALGIVTDGWGESRSFQWHAPPAHAAEYYVAIADVIVCAEIEHVEASETCCAHVPLPEIAGLQARRTKVR